MMSAKKVLCRAWKCVSPHCKDEEQDGVIRLCIAELPSAVYGRLPHMHACLQVISLCDGRFSLFLRPPPEHDEAPGQAPAFLRLPRVPQSYYKVTTYTRCAHACVPRCDALFGWHPARLQALPPRGRLVQASASLEPRAVAGCGPACATGALRHMQVWRRAVSPLALHYPPPLRLCHTQLAA